MSDMIASDKKNIEIVTKSKIKEYLDTFGLTKNLSEKEAAQFTEIATAYNLNPFKREIYCIAYGEGTYRKLSIITGYETYLKRAERLGLLKGWKAWTEGTCEIKKKEVTRGSYKKTVLYPEGELTAKIKIYRADWSEPFEHEVCLNEYAQDNEIWGAKPRTMLKKVVIAQGFRMCFPDEMGGMPYTSDELPPEMGDDELKQVHEQSEPDTVETDKNQKQEMLAELRALGEKLKLTDIAKKKLYEESKGSIPYMLDALRRLDTEQNDETPLEIY